jgi:hypothetical protein
VNHTARALAQLRHEPEVTFTYLRHRFCQLLVMADSVQLVPHGRLYGRLVTVGVHQGQHTATNMPLLTRFCEA